MTTTSPSLRRPPAAGLPTFGGAALRGLVLVLLALAGLQLARGRLGSPAPAAEPNAPPQIAFVEQAAALVRQPATVHALPAGGEALAELAPGTALAVGGIVRVPLGLWARDLYWVRLELPGGARTGFVPVDRLVLTEGSPLWLDLSAVSPEALVAPASALRPLAGAAAAGHAPAGDPAAGGEGLAGALAGLAQAAAGAEGSAAAQAGAGSRDAAAPGPPGDFAIAWLPETVGAWREEILRAGAAHGLDPALIAIVMLVESGGNPRAQSGAGATGLMQVMPATAGDIAAQRGLALGLGGLWEPATNIDFGAWYLARQLSAFGRAEDPDWQQSVELAASAYNGGPGSVQRLLNGGALPNETSRYRQWVGGMWRERGQAQSATYEAWLAAGGARLVEAARALLAAGA